MFRHIEPLEVPPGDPYANDELVRKEIGTNLCHLIQSSGGPFVLGIDGSWGTGKTVFTRMLCQDLRDRDHPCVFFNAWENDFAEDPFVALMAEIDRVSKNEWALSKKSKDATKTWDSAKSAGNALIKIAVPVIVKAATGGLVGKEEVGAITKAARGLSSKPHTFLSEGVEQRIQEYGNLRKALDQFREGMTSFVKSITGAESNCFKPPLVIFIDELDRCRPVFAVELLERVKHLFDCRGMVFVLSTNRSQLQHSVKTLYGAGMDAESYLRRFVDLWFMLPTASPDKYVKFLFDELKVLEVCAQKRFIASAGSGLRDTFAHWADVFRLTLRDQEQCVSFLHLYIRVSPRNGNLYPGVAPFLICLRAQERETYEHYVEGAINGAEVCKLIQAKYSTDTFQLSLVGAQAEALLRGMSKVSGDRKQARLEYERDFKKYERGAPRHDAARCKLKIIEAYDSFFDDGALEELRQRLEMVAEFDIG